MLKLTKQELTQDILKEYLAYDTNTGFITWVKKISNKVNVGERAGSYNKITGYRTLQMFGINYTEHHIIWRLTTGNWPTGQIDHIDHNRANNALSNLREVTIAQNAQNRTARRNTKVREAGIWFCKKRNRYISEISMNGKKVFQKTYPVKDIDLAVLERRNKLIELGFHVNHGSTT